MENSNDNKKDIVIAILVFIIAVLIIVIALFYSGILTGKTNKTVNEDNNTAIEVNKNQIASVSRVEINDNNQEVSIGDSKFNIRKILTVDGAFLLVNDNTIEVGNSETVYAEFAYVTNKYIIFTVAAQDWESIVYVMDKDGKAIAFENNDYQIHDLKVNDGILYASGHIFCGVDGNCPDRDLVIKYENNHLVISPKN